MFGQNMNNNTSIFGQAAATTTSITTTATTTTPFNTSTPSLFGQTTFGQPAAQQASSTPFNFGGGGGGGSSLFGAQQPASSQPQTGFGTTATTASSTASPFNTSTTSLFGQSLSQPAAQPISSTPFNFGGGSSLFGAQQPAASQTPAPAAVSAAPTSTPFNTSTTSLFGQSLSQPTTLQPVSTAPSTFGMGSSLFGAQQTAGAQTTQAAPTATTTTAATTASPFTTPATSTPFNLSTTTATFNTSTPSLFGAQPSATGQTSTTTTTTTAPTFSASGTTTSFSTPAATTAATLTAPTTTASFSAPTTTAAFNTSATTAAFSTATTTAPSNTTIAATPQPVSMTFRQLEDNVNTWLNELNQLEQDFRQQAQAINTWESLLVNNSKKILTINQKVEELRGDNIKLDRALDFIVEQQQEIEKLLEPLEQIKVDTTANGERETTYNLVETVQNELHSLSDDLQTFIVKLNDVRSDDNSSDPIDQIERVLNAQMDALQYVERYINTMAKTNLS